MEQTPIQMGVKATNDQETNMNQEVNEISDTQNNPVLDIVKQLQSKLNTLSESETNNNFKSFNIANTSDNNSNNTDLSGLDISKMIEMINNKNKNNPKSNNLNNKNNSSGLNLDLSSIMNIQKVLNGISQNDPRQDLLTSLKPFLRETRQRNIDTYITLLGVMKAINNFSNKDRD